MKTSANLKKEIYTSFHLGLVEIAINVKAVQEVVSFPDRVIAMPLAPEFLLGVFNLRGMIIPIINLKNLLKHADDKINSDQKVAIVDIEGAKVGLIFDSTSEILRVSADDVCSFNYVSENSHRIISGAIKLNEGERLLQVLDINALLTIENVPQILAQQKLRNVHQINTRLDKRHKCISFSVEGVRMAIEISNIHEILKVPELKDASIQSEIFLGLINLRGITVPVVSFIRILKMEEDKSSCFEMGDKRVIIVKIGEDLVGMLVDTVECINSYYDEDLMAVPMFSKKRLGMFKGCLNLPNEKELFLINHSEILSNKEILDVTEGHSKIYQAARVNNVLKKLNRESYISFRLDHLFGISIKDVKEIINYPEEILAAPGMPFFVKGMLNLRSNLITIIDTRSLYSMTLSNEINSEAKVLIFEKFNERFGLIVDSLESILQIDQDHKFKIPSLVTKAIENKFQSDIKEIISVPIGEKETALIILSIDSIADRIRNQKAA